MTTTSTNAVDTIDGLYVNGSYGSPLPTVRFAAQQITVRTVRIIAAWVAGVGILGAVGATIQITNTPAAALTVVVAGLLVEGCVGISLIKHKIHPGWLTAALMTATAACAVVLAENATLDTVAPLGLWLVTSCTVIALVHSFRTATWLSMASCLATGAFLIPAVADLGQVPMILVACNVIASFGSALMCSISVRGCIQASIDIDVSNEAAIAVQTTAMISAYQARALGALQDRLHNTAANTLAAIPFAAAAGADPELIRARAEHDVQQISNLAAVVDTPAEVATPLSSICTDIAAAASRFGLVADIVPAELPPALLDKHVASLLFTVIEEALLNAAKHSVSAAVGLRFAVGPATVTVSVADRGPGFAADNSMALTRLASDPSISVRVVSTPGSPTVVTVTAPLAVHTEQPQQQQDLDGIQRSMDRSFLTRMLSTITPAIAVIGLMIGGVEIGLMQLVHPVAGVFVGYVAALMLVFAGYALTQRRPMPWWLAVTFVAAIPLLTWMGAGQWPACPVGRYPDLGYAAAYLFALMTGRKLFVTAVTASWLVTAAVFAGSYGCTSGEMSGVLVRVGAVASAVYIRSVLVRYCRVITARRERAAQLKADSEIVDARTALMSRFVTGSALAPTQALLGDLASGRADPVDAHTAAQCAREADFLRALLSIDAQAGAVADVVAAVVIAAHSAGRVVTVNMSVPAPALSQTQAQVARDQLVTMVQQCEPGPVSVVTTPDGVQVFPAAVQSSGHFTG